MTFCGRQHQVDVSGGWCECAQRVAATNNRLGHHPLDLGRHCRFVVPLLVLAHTHTVRQSCRTKTNTQKSDDVVP